MALLTIHADGSYEAVASKITYDSKIKDLKGLIKAAKAELAQRKKLSAPLKRVGDLKTKLVHEKNAAVKEKLKTQIASLRTKHNLSPQVMTNANDRKIKSLQTQIMKYEGQVQALTHKAADAKDKAKQRDAKTTAKPKVNIGGPGIGGAGAKIPRTPKSPAEKFAQGAKTAAGKMTSQVKVTLGRHEAKVLKPAPKPADKPTASTKKPAKVLTQKDNKNATAVKNTLTKIYALKKEIANATPTKKPHMQADLAKLRTALRELRKGATSASKPKLPATVPAGQSRNVKGTPAVTREKIQKMLDTAKAKQKDMRKQVLAAKGPLRSKLTAELQRLDAKVVRLTGRLKQK